MKRGKMKRKIILAMLIIIALVAALVYSWGFFRLGIIKATVHLPLPWWLQNIIWGWK